MLNVPDDVRARRKQEHPTLLFKKIENRKERFEKPNYKASLQVSNCFMGVFFGASFRWT
jgi:hypothetical protein